MEYLTKIQFGTKSKVNVCLLCHRLRTYCTPTWKYGHWLKLIIIPHRGFEEFANMKLFCTFANHYNVLLLFTIPMISVMNENKHNFQACILLCFLCSVFVVNKAVYSV